MKYTADIFHFYRKPNGSIDAQIDFATRDEFLDLVYLHEVEVNFVDNGEPLQGSDIKVTSVVHKVAGTDHNSLTIIDRSERAFDEYCTNILLDAYAEAVSYTLPSFYYEERLDAADFYGER